MPAQSALVAAAKSTPGFQADRRLHPYGDAHRQESGAENYPTLAGQGFSKLAEPFLEIGMSAASIEMVGTEPIGCGLRNRAQCESKAVSTLKKCGEVDA